RNCKSNANRTACGAEDLGIDAYHLAVFIQQGTARISRVDRCIGLDRLIDRASVAGADGSLQSRDDARRQGAVKAERISDREDLLSDLQLVRISKRHNCQVSRRRIYMDDCQIGVRVSANDSRWINFVTAKIYCDLVGSFDNVVIRQDVAVGINNG